MSELGGTLKIVKSKPTDKNIQFQKALSSFKTSGKGTLRASYKNSNFFSQDC